MMTLRDLFVLTEHAHDKWDAACAAVASVGYDPYNSAHDQHEMFSFVVTRRFSSDHMEFTF